MEQIEQDWAEYAYESYLELDGKYAEEEPAHYYLTAVESPPQQKNANRQFNIAELRRAAHRSTAACKQARQTRGN